MRRPTTATAAATATALAIALAACSSDDPIDDCVPAPDAVWLTEGERLELPIDCGVTEIAPLPAGATYDATAAVVAWTPGLDQAGVYALTLDGDHALTIGVADAWGDPANAPIADPLTYTAEYGLPVLFLDTEPTSGDAFEPIELIYAGHEFTAAEGKIRGGVSRGYPKRGYTLRFHQRDRFCEPDRAGGFVNKRKIVLTTTFDDNSLVRQRLAYDLWNELDPGNLPIRSYHAVVYLHREYWGVYLIGDHVDRYFMEQRGLSGDGNVYKAINHDANFRLTDADGDAKATLHDGYEKKDGDPADDFTDLDELVQFAATATPADFAAQVDQRLVRRDYENWYLLVTAIMADDSAGKNSYHYHDPAGGPWRFAPWDFNHSFGQTWRTLREPADRPNDYTPRNRLFELLLGDPVFADPLRARFASALRGPLGRDAALARIGAYAAEIGANALRDQARWGAAYRAYDGWNNRDDFTDYDGELAYLRAWIDQRWTLLLDTYPEAP